MTQVRKLRIAQIIFIVFVLSLFRFVQVLPAALGGEGMTPAKWTILVASLYCAAAGLFMKKRLLHPPKNRRAAARSTPAKRWMAANVVQLAYAVSVGLWGLVFHFEGGPDSVANSLIGLGLILLLVWRPGILPEHDSVTDR